MPGQVISLTAGDLALRLRTLGGAILRFDLGGQPILRPAGDGAGPEEVACFPLAPLGNRIRDNALTHGGVTHTVTPNIAGEPLHLHGESWLADWQIADRVASRLVLEHRHDGPRLPHRYHLRQSFALTPEALSLHLEITNTGDSPLPFGLGWHPFFPASPDPRITTQAADFWSEGPDHLPQNPGRLPPDLDFSTATPLPRRWINNAFSGWSGHADLIWSDRSLTLTADPIFTVMQLYRPANASFFALEPMSHLPGSTDDLRVIEPGESLSGGITLCSAPTRRPRP